MSLHSRRGFLSGLACGCAASALPFAATEVFAASNKPKTSVTADQAIALLKEGNAAFIQGACAATTPARIEELAGGQAPFAVIVACSDSRTPPGALFNRGLGDLFIVRVAGNTVDTTGLGSIEYGVGVLGAPLVVVLGHTHCGAVDAAVKAVRDHAKYPGAIGSVVAPIIPAVKSLKGSEDIERRAVRANVVRTVARLKKAKPILTKGIAEGRVKVIGAIYDIDSGRVDFDVAAA
jgi:carbonic anhydrase